MVAEGTPGELKASLGARTLRIRLADPADRQQAAQVLTPLLGVPVPGEADPALLTSGIAAAHPGPASEQAAAALAGLARAGIAVGEFTLGQPTLDEVFLALTTTSTSRTEKF